MKVLIDGDGCPVIAETERAAALYGLEVLIISSLPGQAGSFWWIRDGVRRTGLLFPL